MNINKHRNLTKVFPWMANAKLAREFFKGLGYDITFKEYKDEIALHTRNIMEILNRE